MYMHVQFSRQACKILHGLYRGWTGQIVLACTTVLKRTPLMHTTVLKGIPNITFVCVCV
jgi:hypothetical protein